MALHFISLLSVTLTVDPARVSRRAFVASSAYAAFLPPAAFAAGVADEVKALACTNFKAGADHSPSVSAKSKSINLVAKVTVTAPPVDAVEYLWLQDVQSATVLAASKSSTSLVTSIDKGKGILARVKYANDGCWEAPAVSLVRGFSKIE